MAYYVVASVIAVVLCLFLGRAVGTAQASRGASRTRSALIAAVIGLFAGAFLGVLIALGSEPLGFSVEEASPAAVAALVGFGGACAGIGGSRMAA